MRVRVAHSPHSVTVGGTVALIARTPNRGGHRTRSEEEDFDFDIFGNRPKNKKQEGRNRKLERRMRRESATSVRFVWLQEKTISGDSS